MNFFLLDEYLIMVVCRYDKDLMFKNLKRVADLKPACDYLSRGLDHFAPSFDNSQALISKIKDRKNCQSLLASVDSHKSKVTSLVSYKGEMVHLLQMATTALDLAANKEQNGVEETKIRILAYGKFLNKLKGVLSALETQWGLKREDYAKPITPASPEPEEENLYSRRVGTVGVPGDPRLANVPMPPVMIPSVPVIPPVVASWTGAQPLPPNQPEDVFHRRDKAGSMTPKREEVWSPTPEDVPFTNPAPSPLPTDDLPFVSPRPRLSREMLPYASPRPPRDDLARSMTRLEVSSRASRTPTREIPWVNPRSRSMTPTLDEPDDTWNTPRPGRSRDEPWTPRVHPQEDSWDTPRRQAWRDEPWSPRPHAREEPFDTPRPHTSRDEPWERSRGLTPTRDELWGRSRGATPTRDEPWDRSRGVRPTRQEQWSPVSPLYTGESSWGAPLKKPVYMPCYTRFHLDNPLEQSEQPFKAPFRRNPPRPNAPAHKPRSLLGEPRPIPRGLPPKTLPGTRPPLLPNPSKITRPPLLPTPSKIPSLLDARTKRKR